VIQSFDWDHGVYLGATSASEATAAALDVKSKIRRDPFAMLPFCGYNMGDYWKHWFEMGNALGDNAPKIFYVNWFRKSSDGRWLWPGFGENSRILKWMCERIEGKAGANKTSVGLMPSKNDLDLEGLDMDDLDISELLSVDSAKWALEIPEIEEFVSSFGDHLPARMRIQIEKMKERLD
jgi:phosphoenolpyruvate carboxykinase (GTP)